MTRQELRILEKELSGTRPETERTDYTGDFAKLATSIAAKGVNLYYNNYMEQSRNNYASKVENEARLANSGDEFVKRVDQFITPQYKNELILSSAHGRIAGNIQNIATGIDTKNTLAIKQLESSNLMSQATKLMNTSANFTEFNKDFTGLIERYKQKNGDPDAITTRNIQNFLETAQFSFASEERKNTLNNYLHNATSSFIQNTGKHKDPAYHINFIDKDIGGMVGDSPEIKKQVLHNIIGTVPTRGAAESIIKHYENILNPMEKESLRAEARSGIKQSQYMLDKELLKRRGEVLASIGIGRGVTNDYDISLLNEQEKIANNFAITTGLHRMSPQDMSVLSETLKSSKNEMRSKLIESVKDYKDIKSKAEDITQQGYISKLVQGEKKLTPEEEIIFNKVQKQLDQIDYEMDPKINAVDNTINNWYKDFTKNPIEAINARSNSMDIAELIIPIIDDKGDLHGVEEWKQSLIDRKYIIDGHNARYGDETVITNFFSPKEIEGMSNILNKSDSSERISLAEKIYNIFGKEDGKRAVAEASGDIALAQSLEEGTQYSNALYAAQYDLKKNDPKTYNEMMQDVDKELDIHPTFDPINADPDLLKKVQWQALGAAITDHNGNIKDALNKSLYIDRNGSVFSSRQDFLMFQREKNKKNWHKYNIYQNILDENNYNNFIIKEKDWEYDKSIPQDNTIWLNNGDSTKSFILMERGQDGFLRPKLVPNYEGLTTSEKIKTWQAYYGGTYAKHIEQQKRMSNPLRESLNLPLRVKNGPTEEYISTGAVKNASLNIPTDKATQEKALKRFNEAKLWDYQVEQLTSWATNEKEQLTSWAKNTKKSIQKKLGLIEPVIVEIP